MAARTIRKRGISMENNRREQRKSERFSRPVCTWLAFDNDNAAYATVTVDVGADGARFKMPRRVAAGEQVFISIQLEAGEIECVGEVCWAFPQDNGLHDFGVRFTVLPHDHKRELRIYLDSEQMSAAR